MLLNNWKHKHSTNKYLVCKCIRSVPFGTDSLEQDMSSWSAGHSDNEEISCFYKSSHLLAISKF
jgi:hypothetical protein